MDGEPLVLILEDHQLVENTFMEVLNSLLSTGDVPGLFKPNELEPLLAPLQDIASESNWSFLLVLMIDGIFFTNVV